MADKILAIIGQHLLALAKFISLPGMRYYGNHSAPLSLNDVRPDIQHISACHHYKGLLDNTTSNADVLDPLSYLDPVTSSISYYDGQRLACSN